MGKIHVERCGYALGARVTGVDLTKPVDDETVAEIERACVENVVICLPGQPLEADALRAFGARFGLLDDNRRVPMRRHPDFETVMMLTNKPVTINGKSAFGRGVAGVADSWHSDLGFTERPSTMTFLVAKELPDVGGETMFASTHAAYEGLSPALKAIVGSIDGVHDGTLTGTFGRSAPEVQAEMKRLNPPVVHPLVRAHPQTGRKALIVGSRIRHFAGFTEEETKPMLSFLNSHATQYEYVYRHKWTVGDLVIWDNRGSMHYAVPDYDRSQLRRMLRCSLVGPKTGKLFAAGGLAHAAVA